MLAEVYNWFTEGFDTKDLQEAQALIEELGKMAKRGNGLGIKDEGRTRTLAITRLNLLLLPQFISLAVVQ